MVDESHEDHHLTVGRVAALAGVTVRTLHHYDEIGLVAPSTRSGAGYRLYERADLERLQEVLFFRELGFPLDEITRIVSDPAYRRVDALVRQRGLLQAQAERLGAVIGAVDQAIDAANKGTTMTDEELLDVFGDFDPKAHEAEAEERWGDTDAYRQSAERTARYGVAEWTEIRREADEINHDLAAVMAAGEPATGEAAVAIAERHRRHLDRWFYDCSHHAHVQLGAMYVADERFRATYDAVAPGLATYLAQAIEANAGRHA